MENRRLKTKWRFYINEITKEQSKEKKTPMNGKIPQAEIADLGSFSKIVGRIQISFLPFFSESRLELYDFDHELEHDISRFSIVNFPVEKSAELYINITLELITGKLDLGANIEAISLYRRLQNFSCVIDVSGHDIERNAHLVHILNDFCAKFRSTSDPQEYSIEVFSIPLGKPKGLQDFLNFKNTADSVKNFLAKREI